MSDPISPVWADPRVSSAMPRQLAARAAALAAGERHRGWKLGFGSPAALASLGTEAALVGYLLAGREIADGATVDVSGYVKPGIEPEVAIHLGADLAPGASREEASAAVAGYGVAIELIDLDLPPADLEGLLAGDIFQRGYVLGPIACAPDEVDVATLGGRVRADDEDAGSVADVTANVGDPLDLVRHAADMLDAFGVALEAGSVLMTGSVVPLVAAQAGRTYTADIDRLGSVSVRLV